MNCQTLWLSYSISYKRRIRVLYNSPHTVIRCVCVRKKKKGHILKWVACASNVLCLLLQAECERFRGVCSDRDGWNSLHTTQTSVWGEKRDCSHCDQSDCLRQAAWNRWSHFSPLQADAAMQHTVKPMNDISIHIVPGVFMIMSVHCVSTMLAECVINAPLQIYIHIHIWSRIFCS